MQYKETFNTTADGRVVSISVDRQISDTYVNEVVVGAIRIKYQSVIRAQIRKGELTDEAIQEVITQYNPEIGAIRVGTKLSQEERAENLARKRLKDNKNLNLEDLSKSKREFWIEYCLGEIQTADKKAAERAAKKDVTQPSEP